MVSPPQHAFVTEGTLLEDTTCQLKKMHNVKVKNYVLFGGQN